MGAAGALFSSDRRENQSLGYARQPWKIDIFHARVFPVSRESKVTLMNHTQTEELKEHEKERDFFCIISDAFRVFARRSSAILGSAWAFVVAVLIIAVWGLTGPTFHFSDTWQLIINTGTTIATFPLVFLIQNIHNRDPNATPLKLAQ